MAAGVERDALVSAALALRYVSRLAYAAGARGAAVEALTAAKRAESVLGPGTGCPGCGGAVEQLASTGRPRRWCPTCRPPETRRKVTRAATVEP